MLSWKAFIRFACPQCPYWHIIEHCWLVAIPDHVDLRGEIVRILTILRNHIASVITWNLLQQCICAVLVSHTIQYPIVSSNSSREHKRPSLAGFSISPFIHLALNWFILLHFNHLCLYWRERVFCAGGVTRYASLTTTATQLWSWRNALFGLFELSLIHTSQSHGQRLRAYWWHLFGVKLLRSPHLIISHHNTIIMHVHSLRACDNASECKYLSVSSICMQSVHSLLATSPYGSVAVVIRDRIHIVKRWCILNHARFGNTYTMEKITFSTIVLAPESSPFSYCCLVHIIYACVMRSRRFHLDIARGRVTKLVFTYRLISLDAAFYRESSLLPQLMFILLILAADDNFLFTVTMCEIVRLCDCVNVSESGMRTACARAYTILHTLPVPIINVFLKLKIIWILNWGGIAAADTSCDMRMMRCHGRDKHI